MLALMRTKVPTNIGISIYSRDGHIADSLIKSADVAMVPSQVKSIRQSVFNSEPVIELMKQPLTLIHLCAAAQMDQI